MTFTSLRPLLRTKDFEATLEFYTRRLGFRCDGRSDSDGWASLCRDAVCLMVATPNAHTPFDAPAFTGSLYFNVDDVQALWETVKDNAQVCYPIEDFHYAVREFAIYDNNGYLLQFGQHLSTGGGTAALRVSQP
jgi:catechol 2,3-dioxygenase-like lactoylglutathione lyase family enzyme